MNSNVCWNVTLDTMSTQSINQHFQVFEYIPNNPLKLQNTKYGVRGQNTSLSIPNKLGRQNLIDSTQPFSSDSDDDQDDDIRQTPINLGEKRIMVAPRQQRARQNIAPIAPSLQARSHTNKASRNPAAIKPQAIYSPNRSNQSSQSRFNSIENRTIVQNSRYGNFVSLCAINKTC